MPSIIKSISLDPQTAQLAAQVPNFSRFDRECLIRHHLEDGGKWGLCKREDEDSKLCLPMVKPRCLKCWPAGKPPHEAWVAYVRKPQTHDPYGKELSVYQKADNANPDYMNHDLVQQAALDSNPALFDFEDMKIEGNAKPAPRTKKSKIRRLWAVLWAD